MAAIDPVVSGAKTLGQQLKVLKESVELVELEDGWDLDRLEWLIDDLEELSTVLGTAQVQPPATTPAKLPNLLRPAVFIETLEKCTQEVQDFNGDPKSRGRDSSGTAACSYFSPELEKQLTAMETEVRDNLHYIEQALELHSMLAEYQRDEDAFAQVCTLTAHLASHSSPCCQSIAYKRRI